MYEDFRRLFLYWVNTLDEFVKRTLIGVYYMWQKYDYWSHNRAVAKAARDAELNPPTLPDHDNTEIPEDPS